MGRACSGCGTARSRALQLGWLHRSHLCKENVENKGRGCAARTSQHTVTAAPSPHAAPTSGSKQGLFYLYKDRSQP